MNTILLSVIEQLYWNLEIANLSNFEVDVEGIIAILASKFDRMKI